MSLKAVRWCMGACARLRDDRGTVAVLFALAIAPLTFLIGAALDYSGASALKAHLQKATDGTSLRLCQIPNNPKKKEVEDVAAKMMSEYFGSTPYTIEDVKIKNNPRSIELSTKAVFSTTIVKAFNASFATVPVTADASCFGEPQTFEIALVLDNTGSMNSPVSGGGSKLEALRTAATDFVNFIYSTPSMASGTRISIVPFAASVAVDPSTYRNASWIDQAGDASYHWNIIREGAAGANAAGIPNRFSGFDLLKTKHSSWDWKGCFESLTFPLNTQDSFPTPSNKDSYYVPMLAPDESGAGGEDPDSGHKDPSNNKVVSYNSYIDDTNGFCPATNDEMTRAGQGCKYLSPQNARTSNGDNATGPNFSCTTRPLTRMTSTKKTLTDEIALLQGNGNTDTHEGLMWGWRTISPVSIFKDGTADQKPASYTKAYNNKIIILMTDGINTWTANSNNVLKSYYSAYGYIKNPDGSGPNSRLPPANANPTTSAQTRAAMDALTLAACANARAAPNNVIIYTIGFNGKNDPIDKQGIDMLKSCAGSPQRAFVANDSSALLTAFRQIAVDIGNLRLTH